MDQCEVVCYAYNWGVSSYLHNIFKLVFSGKEERINLAGRNLNYCHQWKRTNELYIYT